MGKKEMKWVFNVIVFFFSMILLFLIIFSLMQAGLSIYYSLIKLGSVKLYVNWFNSFNFALKVSGWATIGLILHIILVQIPNKKGNTTSKSKMQVSKHKR